MGPGHAACVNTLAPGRAGFNFKSAIFNLVLLIGIFRSSYDNFIEPMHRNKPNITYLLTSYDNALRWMSWDLSEDKSTLVQVMAWCCQAASHYLSQCWPRSVSLFGITRAQWVNINTLRLEENGCHFADNIYKCIVFNENCCTLIQFSWNLCPRVQLTISQHWVR